MVKNPPVNAEEQETPVQSLGWEDPLEEEMVNEHTVHKEPAKRLSTQYTC